MEEFISEPWWLWLTSFVVSVVLIMWPFALFIAHAVKTAGNPQRRVYKAWLYGVGLHFTLTLAFIFYSVWKLDSARYATDKIAVFELGFLVYLVIDLALFGVLALRQRQLRY